jgi:excisionase family DNA binding protein
MASVTIEPLVYSLSEAATALRVSENTLRKMIKSGELQASRIRDRVLIPRQNVLDLVEPKNVK